MKTPLFALLFISSALPLGSVSALIGETQAQIKARMGSPVDVVENQAIYQRGGFTVVVTYWNGVSVFENISRASVNLQPADDPDSDIIVRHIATGDKLSDNELQTLLGVYGAGLPWKPAASDSYNELQAFLDVYWAGLPGTGHKQRGVAPVAREDHAWMRSDGKVSATYQEEQPPVRSRMAPEEEEAIRETPSLLVFNVAFVLTLKRQQETQSSEEAAQKKQAETNQITSVFGPIPTPMLTPPPLHTGSVRVSFDGSGRVASAVIEESCGNGIIDSNTVWYAKANWTGPPNTSTTAPIPIPTPNPLHTPKPPYPYQARVANLQGTGSVRVTFDGSGNVASAVIVESCGSGILDSNAISWAKANWSGPPNSSATIPITYRLQ